MTPDQTNPSVAEPHSRQGESVHAASLFNLPNKLTTLRLGLAMVLFLFIWLRWWQASILLFAAAAFSDWLDGVIARRQGLVSALGRVYDPLVDKILVCGTFIFLSEARNTGLPGDAGLSAFMITIIIAREFIVTGLRGFLEERGVSFGADWTGKLKMVLQCAAILCILIAFALAARGSAGDGLVVLRDVLNWSTVTVTFLSGAHYVWKAVERLG